jgi:endonuclease YncB( thermonuclease family)
MNVEWAVRRYLFAPYRRVFVLLGARRALSLLLVAAMPLGASASAFSPNSIRERVRVIDGDSLEVAGATIRPLDVDAFELAQRCEGPNELAACGSIAATALGDQVQAQSVTFKGDERDDYGRLLARCMLGEVDLSSWLVEQGHGPAYRRYSTRLVPLEEEAKGDRRGLSQTEFEPPWAYQRGVGRALPPRRRTAAQSRVT